MIMKAAILSLFAMLLFICGCSSTEAKAVPMPGSRAASQSPARIVININCPFTNGYVYLSVSTDLIHWSPFDTKIYDAGLPRIPGTSITNFIRADMPQRFAMYVPTNWPPEEP